MKTQTQKRLIYAALFLLLLVTEVFIALFVDDLFIRPYGGDILVTMLLCCMIRIFFPEGLKTLPLYVFLFALAIEIGQYFNFVALIGLDHIEFFRILMGTSFSFIDILCYAAGCILFFTAEWLLKKRIQKNHE